MMSVQHLIYQQCRVCYNSTNNLQLLSNCPQTCSQESEKSYAHLLTEVCKINILEDEPLGLWPQFICYECSQKLQSAFEFIQETLKTNNLLKSIAAQVETKTAILYIEKPELDIPLEIKIEEDVEVLSNDKVFHYSPVDTNALKADTSLLPPDICGNVPKYLTNEELEGILNVSDDEDYFNSEDNHSSEENCESKISEDDSEPCYQNQITDALEILPANIGVDPLFLSKDGIVWNPQPVYDRTERLQTENVINLHPGSTRYARANVNDIKGAFMLFFPPTIEKVIIKWSNIYAKAECGHSYIEIDSELLYAYIGVLILAGVYRSKNETMSDLFDGDYGRPIFRAIMSKKTFQYMNRVICFDDVINRRQTSSTDKFSPIREIFDKWAELLSHHFNPSECVTVHEQLLGFRGRCKFRQYMPSKPLRYGIKFWLLVCSETCYVWKIQPYLGKPDGSLPERNQGERVVLDLVHGLKGHNITMDNFFSSYQLGQKLLSRGLTMVGTMHKKNKSIPPKLLECKKVPLYQSTFAFTENTTLVSYVRRKNNRVVLQSTKHHSNDVESDAKKLPEIIQFYNKTKGGVDTVDKMLSCYSSKRRTNRWPVSVFSNMIDISALNAFIIFKDINTSWKRNKPMVRQVFLRELGVSLAKPYMAIRQGIPRTQSAVSLLSAISQTNLVNEPSGSKMQSQVSLIRKTSGALQSSSQSFESPSKKQKTIPPIIEGKSRCHICYSEKSKYKNYVHQTICCFCQKGVCKRAHNRNVCEKCVEDKLM